MSDADLVKECNALAMRFYAEMGYRAKPNYKFHESTHPQELMCWRMAVVAYDHVNGTDIENALAEGEGND